MATVVLQTVGAAVGSAVGGPFGAIVGRAAGALAGAAIDQKLFSKDQVIQGPRLENAQVLTSNVGAPIPRAYGFNRLAGEIIWATRFEEVSSTTTQSAGGKGTGGQQTRTTRFAYFANFAVGICEGPISGIRRIWADNDELDLTQTEYRIYTGDEDQLPDPLIEAKQGLGNAPAYRGLAYVVFDSLPLEKYGNRIPQISFEIINGVGKLEQEIRSITIIPGSTEFGYDPHFISSGGGDQPFAAHNRHVSIANTDWKASIDELQMLCPNLESVSLVISWFGTDLRAGVCNLAPGVTVKFGPEWNVAGTNRFNAYIVSQVDDRPAFGGTPTDASILSAITDLKARGLKVVFYPFIMMDIPQGNNLPGLYEEASQPVYPWRGEISCFPAPGIQDSADKTEEARIQLDNFSSQYLNFIRHYISLCKNAGGVDGFLIGSELCGVTRVRDQNGSFPFVETLMVLASEAKTALGPDCFVTYGADWSEYFGYQPQDGSGDVLYNLDTLWASPAIDAVGIDNYMPLADWRESGDPGYAHIRTPYDIEYLKSNIAANEGFDWFYANDDDRQSGDRTPITDGQGEPWIYRYKDLVSWWSLPHHERDGGVRSDNPTVWVPQSKPFFMTEIGCPAVDKGANQPNVFYDPKSDQSALPYKSLGGRDDLIQRRFLEAYYTYWKEPKNNPISTIDGRSMLDVSMITPWTWDARPFPWFPLDLSAWSDGTNWHTGHWLNGRLGACPLQELINTILDAFGLHNVDCRLDGLVEGYVIPSQASAREALEPLLQAFNIQVLEEQGRIIMRHTAYADRIAVNAEKVIQEDDQPQHVSTRDSELELPSEVVVNHSTVFDDYEQRSTKSRRVDGSSDRQISMQLPVVISENIAIELAEKRLRQDWIGRKNCTFTVSNAHYEISPGDILSFTDTPDEEWIILAKNTSGSHEIATRSHVELPISHSSDLKSVSDFSSFTTFGKPSVSMMDLPLLRVTEDGKLISHLALYADPKTSAYGVFSSPANEDFRQRNIVNAVATIGFLMSEVTGSHTGLFDKANRLRVRLLNNSFQSIEKLAVLNGGNLIAVQANNGEYELIQYKTAELQQDGSWILSELLRARFGSDPAMSSGLPVNAKVVVINEALVSMELEALELGVIQNWRIGPSNDPIGSESYETITHVNHNLAGRMLSPAHLRMNENSAGEMEFSWIRRGRILSDNWEGAEIPLDANIEHYQIEISGNNNIPVRVFQLASSSFQYSLVDRLDDLGSVSQGFTFKVAQIGDNGLPGTQSEIQIIPDA